MCISVDGSRIRNNKVAFSNLSGIVWTGPQSRQTRYRVGISSWTFELDFRVGLSSWTFELDFRVGFSSWTFELDFRVWISSWTFQQEASADVTADLDPLPPRHFFLYRKKIEIMYKLGVGRYSRQCLLFLLSNI